jgi:hypothetical protein
MPPPKVFISYSASDRHIVSQIAEELENSGADVWYADRDLRAGKQISNVFHQIESADFVLVALSRASVPSGWVSAEMQGALAAMRAGRALRVVPILLETVDLPVVLADTVSVDLRPLNYDAGIARLRNIIAGEDPGEGDDFLRFRRFTEKLTLVSPDAARVSSTLASLLQSDTATTDIQGRARKTIDDELVKSDVSEADRNRIVKDLEAGKIPLIMATTEREDVRRFTRYGDTDLLKFASDLHRQRGMSGVTLRAVVEFVRWKLSEKDEDRAVTRAESLVARAREMLLLARSTENPSGYSALDAEQNPSYDMGPMVAIVGRLAAAFEESESNSMRPSK